MVTLCRQKPVWINKLNEAGVFAPAFELGEILRYATGLTLAQQLAQSDEPLSEQQLAAVEELLVQRCGGRPLQYILGQWEFYGLDFYVGEGVLIPRADTETLVDTALDLCGDNQLEILDLCSGSGCIAAALAVHLPKAHVTAVELSCDAYAYLVRNLALHDLGNVTPLHADVLTSAGLFHDLDLVVSNPPYIPSGELEELQREVRREPAMALDGFDDGLYFYREISSLYYSALKSGGWLAFESGDGQSGDICAVLQSAGYTNITTRDDLGGFTRVVCGQKNIT